MKYRFHELNDLMQQAALQECIADAAAAVARRWTDCRIDERHALEDRALLHESLAATAADLAQAADRTGHSEDGDRLWSVARGSRVRAMLLRARSGRD